MSGKIMFYACHCACRSHLSSGNDSGDLDMSSTRTGESFLLNYPGQGSSATRADDADEEMFMFTPLELGIEIFKELGFL